MQAFSSPAATMARGDFRTFSTGTLTGKFEEKGGVREYEPSRVFKAGTFKDSMGFQTTWEKEHLAQMVFNFSMLRDRGIFRDLPVRDGHPSMFGGGSVSGKQAGRIIGYVTDLATEDADGTTFLTASFSVLNKEDQEYMDNGTFRARSAEVGFFESNDEALYWPVFQGFAFVDIGAVEGLYEKAKQTSKSSDFAILIEKEAPVGTKATTTEEPGTDPATPPATDPPATPDAPDTPPAPPSPPAEPQTHTATAGATHTFRVGGHAVSDFAAVQTHIDTLEGSLREIRETERKEFVNGLISTNRVPATDGNGLEKLVLSMTDEQYEMYRGTYKDTPSIPLLGNHSAGAHGGGTPPVETGDGQHEVDLGIVAQFQKAGKPNEWIKNSGAYKRLESAGKAPGL